MDAFAALAEPHRRQVVEILARRGRLTASEISGEFDVTPQAISQHLRILREAKVLRMEKDAQRRIYTIDPRAMTEIEDWAAEIASSWGRRLDRLERTLEERER